MSLPRWRRPIALLFMMAAAMPMAFATWAALLNNFVIDVAQFDGADIGLLHSVREIPGFLAVGVIALIMFIREQVLGIIALILLGAATAVTAWFPSMGGILTITMLSSIGFHYYETVNQSLQLQWLSKDQAPKVLGWLMAAGSAVTFAAYGVIVLTWETLGLGYNLVYLVSGGLTVLIALFCLLAYPQFQAPTRQHTKIVLRRRYWLYYCLQFTAGARRQIFIVFAGFLMVEKFGYSVAAISALFLVNATLNMLFAARIGRIIGKVGERAALVFEYAGLVIVFVAYAFVESAHVAAGLYIVDHFFFALAIAIKTYFQKIADPADIASSAGVSFTINHIAAVVLPAALGIIWLTSPAAVFLAGAGLAGFSLLLSLNIPTHPEQGNEVTVGRWGSPLSDVIGVGVGK